MNAANSIEYGYNDTNIRFLQGVFNNVKRQKEKQILKKQAKYQNLTPAETFHMHRREKQDKRHFLNRIGFLFSADNTPILRGNKPEIDMLSKILGPDEGFPKFVSMPMWDLIISF